MSNSAIITTKEKHLAIYLYQNGGRDMVESFLKYCSLQGYCSPCNDSNGWVRLYQVIEHYMGGSSSIVLDTYERLRGHGDNGAYIIEGWEIVGREGIDVDYTEEDCCNLDDILESIDECMPKVVLFNS